MIPDGAAARSPFARFGAARGALNSAALLLALGEFILDLVFKTWDVAGQIICNGRLHRREILRGFMLLRNHHRREQRLRLLVDRGNGRDTPSLANITLKSLLAHIALANGENALQVFN